MLLEELVHNIINEPSFRELQVVGVRCQKMKTSSFVQLLQAQGVLKIALQSHLTVHDIITSNYNLQSPGMYVTQCHTTYVIRSSEKSVQ